MDTIYFDKSGSIPGFEYSSNGESGFIEAEFNLQMQQNSD